MKLIVYTQLACRFIAHSIKKLVAMVLYNNGKFNADFMGQACFSSYASQTKSVLRKAAGLEDLLPNKTSEPYATPFYVQGCQIRRINAEGKQTVGARLAITIIKSIKHCSEFTGGPRP
jgi:hypothetical protein